MTTPIAYSYGLGQIKLALSQIGINPSSLAYSFQPKEYRNPDHNYPDDQLHVSDGSGNEISVNLYLASRSPFVAAVEIKRGLNLCSEEKVT